MDSSHLSRFIYFADDNFGTNNVGALVGFIVGLVLLCLLSFFTTLCEVAYRESSPTKLRYAYRKSAGRLAFKLVEKKDMVVMCNRLLDVLCTIAIVIVAIYLGLLTIGSNWLVILMAILVAFFVAIVLGEVIPSTIAQQRPERCAVIMSYPMAIIFYLFYPLTFIFYEFTKLLKKWFHIQETADVSEKELIVLASDAYREGSIEKEEHDLVLNSLNFDDKTIERIMVPVRNFSAVNTEMTIDKICKLFEETNYSRLPVFDEKTKKFIGILHQKDFYELMIRNKGQEEISSIINPALFMDYKTNCSKALKRFQALRQHIAFVRKDGIVIGLITIEDLLEELVGDIEDEYDAEDLEKEAAEKLQARSDKADAQEVDRRREEFKDSVILTGPEDEGDSDESPIDDSVNDDSNDA